MDKKESEDYRKEFRFIANPSISDNVGVDVELAQHIHLFAQQVSYTEASMMGGKITPVEAMQRFKDLYKHLKSINKTIKKKS